MKKILLLVGVLGSFGICVGALTWKITQLDRRLADLESLVNRPPPPATLPAEAVDASRLDRLEERIALVEESLDKKILHDAMEPKLKLKAIRDLPGRY
jgi:hypothetical protein